MSTTSIAVAKLRQQFRSRIDHSKPYRYTVLCTLHRSQTSDEQATKKTKHLNGAGFNAPDAPGLSALAVKVKAGKSLSPSEELLLRYRLPKYVLQFARVIRLDEMPMVAAALKSGLKKEAA